MYLTMDQVTLVGDKGKVRPHDPVIYERDLAGNRIFTTDGGPSKYAGSAMRYGVLYFDAREQPCIVPDTWNEDDAGAAKLALPQDAV
jgi:hypothetical protein